MRLWAENARNTCVSSPSQPTQREHASDVPAHRHQIPLAFGALKAPQQELAETHHRFDDSEHRLGGLDRKSTRLNSSHSQISYAVFCLKKKKIKIKMR